MPHDLTDPIHRDAEALHHELLNADDDKMRQILSLIDSVSDPKVNQAILDPHRSRVASLKPHRPLRFRRLLFIPFGPLIVSPHDWRAGEATVPRNAMASISRSVRTGLGGAANTIDKIIADHGSDQARAIALAGDALWPRAGEILAVAEPPDDWAETGLPSEAYVLLAHALAAVLRRAVWLGRLAREWATGTAESNGKIVNEIVRDIATESPDGYAMIARLILLRSPRAISLMRQIVSRTRDPAGKTMLRLAIAHATDSLLAYLESEAGLVNEVGRAAMTGAGDEVHRIVTLLREIEGDVETAQHRPRIKAIRARLDTACRDLFSDGVRKVLVERLTEASVPVSGAEQTELEAGARDLRALETMARKVGGHESYDLELSRTSGTVRAAVEAGTLTPMRGTRLVEILSGPEAAEAHYLAQSNGAGDSPKA